MKLKYVAIELPPKNAATVTDLRGSIPAYAQRYGFKEQLRHGSSPPHIPLVRPGEYDERILDHAVTRVVSISVPFKLKLSKVGASNKGGLYLTCDGDMDALDVLQWTLAHDLDPTDSTSCVPRTPVFKNIDPQHLEALHLGAQEAYDKLSWSLFDVENVTVYGRNAPYEQWKAIAHQHFSGKQKDVA